MWYVTANGARFKRVFICGGSSVFLGNGRFLYVYVLPYAGGVFFVLGILCFSGACGSGCDCACGWDGTCGALYRFLFVRFLLSPFLISLELGSSVLLGSMSP